MRGRVVLRQPRVGYRANVDALWLSDFALAPKRACDVLDLGAGVGAVGLSLLAIGGALRATLLDVDEPMLDLAQQNAASAGLAERVSIAGADLRRPLPIALHGAFDLVVANPPYEEHGSARAPPDAGRARGRIADVGTLECFVRAARLALGKAGRFCLVFPSDRLERLLSSLTRVGLHPKRLRMVHPLPDSPARLVLVEAKPARPGGLRVMPPLFAMTRPNEWSAEARRILDGEAVAT